MRFYKQLLLIISFFFSQAYPCGACRDFAMGNVPMVPHRLVNTPMKVFLKTALRDPANAEVKPVIKCRNVTLLNSDDLAEIIVDVGTSVMYSQKFTGGFSPFTLAVATKQTLKVVAREKTLQAITFVAHEAQKAAGINLPTLNEENSPSVNWTAAAASLTAGAARTAIRLGLDYCLDSAEAWLIHKATKRQS